MAAVKITRGAMKYLHVTELDGRYLGELRETGVPVPGTGEVLLRVTASGVNRADLSQIAGRYPPPPGESQILGLEASGTGEGTSDPVCALLAGGGHAEYVAVPQGQLIPAPPAARAGERRRHPGSIPHRLREPGGGGRFDARYQRADPRGRF